MTIRQAWKGRTRKAASMMSAVPAEGELQRARAKVPPDVVMKRVEPLGAVSSARRAGAVLGVGGVDGVDFEREGNVFSAVGFRPSVLVEETVVALHEAAALFGDSGGPRG